MIEINEALTQKVAEMARLELTVQEAGEFAAQLHNVLKYVHQLSEVAVEGVAPLTRPFEPKLTPLREDRVEDFEMHAAEGYRVPPIL